MSETVKERVQRCICASEFRDGVNEGSLCFTTQSLIGDDIGLLIFKVIGVMADE